MSWFNQFMDGAVTIVLAYGLPGVVMGGLCIAIFFLRKDRADLFARYCDIQEKRIMEAQASMTALNANTAALLKLSENLGKA